MVYKGLENAGISLQALDGERFGCFVGSYASSVEVSETKFSVLDNFVEIEIYAAGLTFKVSDRKSTVTFPIAAKSAL